MEEVKTGVDELVELVRSVGRISIPDAAKKLKVSEKTIQNWVDFLVEERLLGIEYKFTTPYIYLNTTAAAKIVARQQSIADIKKLFVERAQEKGMPVEKIGPLWKNHLLQGIDAKARFFQMECAKRKLQDADTLFSRYKEKVLAEHELR